MFLSHPYLDDPEENMKQVTAIASALLDKGVLAVSPLHLFTYIDSENNLREDIMTICFQLIEYYPLIRTRSSLGCDEELEYALQIGQDVVELEEILPCYQLVRK